MLRVTADDFGLSQNINRGIIQAHRDGIVTSASLLITGPAVKHALDLAAQHLDLEVGLHLAFVEAPSASECRNSVSSRHDYFPGRICLHAHWKRLLLHWMVGRINPSELRDELNSQCAMFQAARGKIPFLNSTQHLHLFPPFSEIILELMEKYQIPSIRLFGPQSVGFSVRSLQERLLQRWSQKLHEKLFVGFETKTAISLVQGFQQAGKVTVADLRRFLSLARGEGEIMVHPGEEDPSLKNLYSGAFRDYRWSEELQALCSSEIFADLKT